MTPFVGQGLDLLLSPNSAALGFRPAEIFHRFKPQNTGNPGSHTNGQVVGMQGAKAE